MLTYAGQPLVVASKELRDKVEDLLATENLYEHARLHWNANEAFPTQLGVVVDHHVEIGKLFWPSGASRWAIGHFLVHQTEAEAIQEAVWGTAGTEYNSADLVMKWEEASYENGVESETDTVVDSITATLYAFPLRPISVDDEASLYLLTLVDERFFWWSKNTGNLAATSSSTWSDIYTSLGTALGTTITPEAVDASYLAPGELVRLFYEPLPPWLDTVAWNVGQRIVVGLDGSVTAENPTVTAPSDTEGVLAGGEYLGSVDESNGPADGVGVFPDYSSGSFQGGYNAQTGTGTGSEGTVVLRSPIKYTGSNGAALATLTQKFLDDFTTWQTGSQDVKLAGIVNVTPSGAYGNILWTYRRDELSTRVQPCDYPVRSFEPLTVNNVVSASICVRSCVRASHGSNTHYVLGLGISAKVCSVSCVKAYVDYPASTSMSGQSLHVFMGSKSCVRATQQIPTFSTGTTGTDVNWTYSSGVYTYNLPDASTTNRGAMTTGSQTFSGQKIFDSTSGITSYGAFTSWGTTGPGTTRLQSGVNSSAGLIQLTTGGGLATPVVTVDLNSVGHSMVITQGTGPSTGSILINGAGGDYLILASDAITMSVNGAAAETGQTGTYLGLEFTLGVMTGGSASGSPVASVTAGDDTIAIGGTAADPTVSVATDSPQLNLAIQGFGP